MSKDEVSVLIAGKEFRFWMGVVLREQMDGFATIEFAAPFEPDRKEFRETFRPFSFKPLEVLIDGDTALTGTMVGIDPASDVSGKVVAVTGYSLPGVLADCSGPESFLPLEFKNQGLKHIASSVAFPYGITVQFDADEGAAFEKAKIEPAGDPFSFLSELARQRNLVWTSTASGKLLCHQSVATGSPVARLRSDAQPVTGVSARFGPQAYYSEITGFTKAKKGSGAARYTVKNPWLSDVVRPMSFSLDDTKVADGPAAVKAKMGRMFANACSFEIQVATWRDPSGKPWKPNTTITLLAPDVMVYRETEFIIRAVSRHADKDSRTASLEVVLPGAFNGEIPDSLPWDESDSIISGGLLEQVAGLV